MDDEFKWIEDSQNEEDLGFPPQWLSRKNWGACGGVKQAPVPEHWLPKDGSAPRQHGWFAFYHEDPDNDDRESWADYPWFETEEEAKAWVIACVRMA